MLTEIFWALIALRMAAGAVRVRAALRRLPIATLDGDVDGFVAVLGPGARPSQRCLRAAGAWAAGQGLEVVHLLPEHTTIGHAWMAGFVLDRAQRDDDWLEAKEATGWATIVHRDVLERAGVAPAERFDDPAALVVLQKKLSRYGRSGVAVAAGGELEGPDPFADRAALEESLNAGQAVVLGPPLIIALLLAGPFLAPWAGSVALVLFALQQAIALSRGPLHVPLGAFLLSPLTRLPWQVIRWVRTLLAPSRRLHRAEALALRPIYAELMKDGLGRFFEERQTACPLCGGAELTVALRSADACQGKPGTFTIERCGACDHLFQNPRLSLAGLDFYYRDFYDGLGGEDVETLFASAAHPYAERAEMVSRRASPTRWLDVGCGHGHFCARGKELLPECTFDGIDLSDSVLDAQRRGWLDEAHRGLFPELAEQLADRYDAVSMSHYLEHTTDPRAEIAAAAKVLRPGGHLVIEVPDPESWVGGVLGPLWIPWFQPQHLHFVSAGNLDRLFEEHGLEAVEWHRREAHIPSDLLFAVWLGLQRLSRTPGMPWHPPATPAARVVHAVVSTLGMVPLVVAIVADKLLSPIVAATGGANAYRVVARRT